MKIKLVKSDWLDDWYIIEKVEHDNEEWFKKTEYGFALMCSSRISDADVEGSAAEMIEIAKAIIARSSVSFRRCAVYCDETHAHFSSPRNSTKNGSVTLAEADALAVQILKELDKN